MTERAEIPDGLRRAYVLALAPAAALAPVPLFWTNGATVAALVFFEAALALLWWRARQRRPVRLSNAILNTIGLSYLFWLVVEIAVLRPGLLRTVAHLLLFTAVAKLASVKHPGEARTALLVVFLVALAAASSSFHASSLLYFAAMAWLGFRTLCRLAVLADFDTAPPDRVLTAVPTGGLAFAAIAGAVLLGGPLFYLLPRLRAPYAVAPFRMDEALSTTLTADRVDLEAFASAKKSDRVVLQYELKPESEMGRAVRLREAVFTDYHEGTWLRGQPSTSASGRIPSVYGVPRRPPAGTTGPARMGVELNVVARGFLFLPYGSYDLALESGASTPQPDGIVQVSGGQRAVRYSASVARVSPHGLGRSAMDYRQVPPEIRRYALELTEGLTDPVQIADRIERHFRTGFVYTLDPPRVTGDPIVHFLLRSKTGHCEYFASAMVMLLTARGIPARLVTGSYGAEVGYFSSWLIVRGSNLHAWVEADLGGSAFAVLDPTPPSGLPSERTVRSLWERLTSMAREIEFFYDRRILGFDSIDQAGTFETARQTLGAAVQALLDWKAAVRNLFASPERLVLVVLLAALAAGALTVRQRRRAPVPATTRAYLALRRLVSRRVGSLSPAVPPAEVARLFANAVPQGRGDAFAIVDVYCAAAFGSRTPDAAAIRDLEERLGRLRQLA